MEAEQAIAILKNELFMAQLNDRSLSAKNIKRVIVFLDQQEKQMIKTLKFLKQQ